ncbi:iridoid oxidase-like [Mercurialis annua]|uniref:iridoid oxidase-like n=1 Tax=Mercurialis annua TaxID=3986 RepID=UPI00215E4D44|nr:iridoid oxidase-like [Mercurialis annua]
MEYITILIALLSIFISVALNLYLKGGYRTKNRPPGPSGWPVIGNIFDLGAMPHQSLYKLKSKYGPVMWLKLGSRNTMVIQSAAAAAELFKNHDANFCDRMSFDVFTSHNYDKGSLAMGRYGPFWRILRRICATELMTNKRVNDTVPIRRKCVDQMIKYVEDNEGSEVDLVHLLFLTAFNVIGNLTLSQDLLDPHCKEGHNFYKAMDKFMVWAGTPNFADFLPFLKFMDPQGLKRKMNRDLGQAVEIIAGFVKERMEEKKAGKEKQSKDFLDVVLEYEGDGKEGPQKLSYDKIVIIVLEMFFAGSETTSTTMEWAMAELMRSPEKLQKLKQELNEVIGDNKKVEESDIDRLPYLQAVVKETFRLHPAIPLLLPRNTMQDTNFMGYHIPKNTQVFVNAWAIGRDEESWEDSLAFKPERFLGSNIDYKGQDFQLIPFGLGRRICVGMLLGLRLVYLGLASLVHTFDWEIGSNSGSESIDMNERTGITVRKLVPLKLVPKKRIKMRN